MADIKKILAIAAPIAIVAILLKKKAKPPEQPTPPPTPSPIPVPKPTPTPLPAPTPQPPQQPSPTPTPPPPAPPKPIPQPVPTPKPSPQPLPPKTPTGGIRITELTIKELYNRTRAVIGNALMFVIRGKLEGTGEAPPPGTIVKPIGQKEIYVFAKTPSGNILKKVVTINVLPGQKTFMAIQEKPYMMIHFIPDEPGTWEFWAEADGVKSNILRIEVRKKPVELWYYVKWEAVKNPCRGYTMELLVDGQKKWSFTQKGWGYRDAYKAGIKVQPGTHTVTFRLTSTQPCRVRAWLGLSDDYMARFNDAKIKKGPVEGTTPVEVTATVTITEQGITGDLSTGNVNIRIA